MNKKRRSFLIFAAFFAVSMILTGFFVLRELRQNRKFEHFTQQMAVANLVKLPTRVFFRETFSDHSLSGWQEEIRHGKTKYTVEPSGDNNYSLRAESNLSASLLFHKMQYEPASYPYLKWRWRVDKHTGPADMARLEGSDASARIYVVFSYGFSSLTSRLISYVWASSTPKGSSFSSFFSPNCRIMVIESGIENLGAWVSEERNVFEDYQALFGEAPKGVLGIAVMTDSDNTRSSAIAYYDDIIVSSKPV